MYIIDCWESLICESICGNDGIDNPTVFIPDPEGKRLICYKTINKDLNGC